MASGEEKRDVTGEIQNPDHVTKGETEELRR